MDIKREMKKISEEVVNLPVNMQNMVAEDIIETARERIRTMRRICMRR